MFPAPSAAIDLLGADEALAAAVPDEDLVLAHRVLTVPRVDAVAGAWRVPPRTTWREPVTALVIAEGALCRHARVAGRRATQFLGPGDVVQPWATPEDAVPSTETWTVHARVAFAVLDRRFTLAASRWPALTSVLVDRMAEQAARAAVTIAIAQLPRVEQRVLAMLWQLSDRFGRVGPTGVVIDLRLTHATIGECVGARRPTVTLALRALADDGMVHRRGDGGWVLAPESRALLEQAIDLGADAAV